MNHSIIQPKVPSGPGWAYGGPVHPAWTVNYPGQVWHYQTGLIVISAVEVVSDPTEPDIGPEYHLSISRKGSRCSRNEARFVVKAFGMEGAEEDNHVPGGFVRNFWRPVAEHLIGRQCPCKKHEPAMVEDRGEFTWRGITK